MCVSSCVCVCAEYPFDYGSKGTVVKVEEVVSPGRGRGARAHEVLTVTVRSVTKQEELGARDRRVRQHAGELRTTIHAGIVTRTRSPETQENKPHLSITHRHDIHRSPRFPVDVVLPDFVRGKYSNVGAIYGTPGTRADLGAFQTKHLCRVPLLGFARPGQTQRDNAIENRVEIASNSGLTNTVPRCDVGPW